MNGLMQASFYFGYMLMVCYGESKCGAVKVKWAAGQGWEGAIGGGPRGANSRGWQRRHASSHNIHSSLLTHTCPAACLPPLQASS